MIVDLLENIGRYAGISKNFEKAAEFILGHDLSALPEGRTEIDGDNVFAMTSRIVTQPVEERRYEGHKNYMDIQCIVRGDEVIYYTPAQGLQPLEAYSPERDIVFFSDPAQAIQSPSFLRDGMFAAYAPQDAHKPCCAAGSPCEVLKVVIKVRV